MEKTPNPDPKRDPESEAPDYQTPGSKTPDPEAPEAPDLDAPDVPEPELPDSQVQGEGDYDAARRYRTDVEGFVEETGPDGIKKKAEDAEKAILGAEGEDLRRAEAEGEVHAKR